MKLQSLLVSLALLPAALFAGNPNSGATSTPTGPTVIPGGTFTAPYVISTPGAYVLGGNRKVSADVNVIEITAPDVTFDLSGFALDQANGLKSGILIAAAENVEIRSGSILHSLTGIDAQSGKGLRVSNVRFAGPKYAGVRSFADGTQIERCRVDDSQHGLIVAGGGGSLVTDCVLNTTTQNGNGVMATKGSMVVRVVAKGFLYGFSLIQGCSAVECTAAGCFYGFDLQLASTLRDSTADGNKYGVSSNTAANFITGTRISNSVNGTIVGSYTGGIGNFIQ